MLSVNISDIAITTVKYVDYCCIIHEISKFKKIILLKTAMVLCSRFIWIANSSDHMSI